MIVDLHVEERSPAISLAGLAYQQIKDRLIMLDIRPGDPINDVALAAELGVGRTPVREALKRLETDHLVVSYPRRGTFATVVDVTELGSISDIRQLLEPHAARRAAENATPAQRLEMRETANLVRDLQVVDGDRTAFITEDRAIHQLIYRATGNSHLEDVLTRYDNLATRIWCLVIDKLPDLAEHIRDHAGLLEAIAAGDGDLAASLTLGHVTGFERAIRSVL
ncbi:putative GntR family transcriptional regulator [Microlunatus phosphovorus NM-1]|uniref:Putative GntR family transcriptional regulator n=1 Tax=Microlunatus phosphovorus (strain ATCC 700054 / DSM 10555 / JCM 9379 / NBRC 101784 / NCIMB 13414 / VKM Ac-1990 / NM-1) TaxID=1032480 RepID=F5XDR5_MICPN|nr:GntR family transcriptional regulator [Microlunatus phosphovorus]BAK35088.1 putative GntR family transcriptional regulator [Microlunatus phosphovorus NM-1]